MPITILLDKDIQDIPILIDRAPKRVQFAVDLDKHLIEEPDIASLSQSMTNVIGVILTEFQTPLTNSFVGNHNTSRGQDFFNITKTQGKSKVQPYRMADDFSRIPLSCIRIV